MTHLALEQEGIPLRVTTTTIIPSFENTTNQRKMNVGTTIVIIEATIWCVMWMHEKFFFSFFLGCFLKPEETQLSHLT